MIDDAHQFKELEEKILYGGDMPPAELERVTGTLRDQIVPDTQPQDLGSYRQRKAQQEKERQRLELPLSERVVGAVKRAFGFTESRYARKVLSESEALETMFEEQISDVERVLDLRREQHQEASKRHMRSEMYFTAVQQQYADRQQLVDRLEAELEVMQSNTTRSITAELYETRERLTSTKKDLLSLRKDADQAMSIYTSSKYEDGALETQVNRFQEDLIEFNAQKAQLSMLRSSLQVDNLVNFGSDGQPSVKQLYEDIGIYAQRMNTLMERHKKNGSERLDSTYRIGRRDHGSDPLVAQWLKLRSA